LRTIVGERGVNLSGGERQRIAIARALAMRSEVIIFDEATSALDPRTESEILETIRAVTKGKTTITISHRLIFAREAERVIVLGSGKIVEEGTHSHLIGSKGDYHRLFERDAA
jgi:ABC-type multidrug transport system fused ATPase/permease subunit